VCADLLEGEVRLTVLGCGDAFGSGGRYQTCFYVESASATFLIDCGASSLIAMKRFGIDPGSIDVILVTHLHGDHFGGIPFLERETQIAASRSRPLTLAGPDGFEETLSRAMEVLFPGSTKAPRTFPLEFVRLVDGERNTVGPLIVGTFPVIHTAGTHAHALRVEVDGRILAYSGDTEWCDALLEAAAGADLFICEAYTYDRKQRNHLDYMTLASRRQELRCRRLLLTHLSDEMLARRELVESEDVVVANDGMSVRLLPEVTGKGAH
jgi:ribonuclease BN (tRNA processing enzyme)